MAKHRHDTRPRRGRGEIVRVGPTMKELEKLCKSVKGDIEDDFRATDSSGRAADEEEPGILLTVGADDQGGWSYQTGDTSYMGRRISLPVLGSIGDLSRHEL